MSEISKKRGEFGEKIVSNLLSTIGWDDFLEGREIDCFNPLKHKISTKERKTHGVDFLYKYECPLFSDTDSFVLISSKINNSYPTNPSNTFKSHLKDISESIDCFKKSQLKNIMSNRKVNINNKFYGVIFWLDNNDRNNEFDLIEKLSDVKIDEDITPEAIYIVDNKRANFLFETIEFAKKSFNESTIEFVHPSTGYNSTAKQRLSSSNILPIQYINSSILPIKVTMNSDDSSVLLLNCIDNFEEEYLIKLISISQKLTENWGKEIYILFPEYNDNSYKEIVDNVKLNFRDKKFVKKVKVSTFRKNFKNV